MIRFVQFRDPVTVTGLPQNINSSLQSYDCVKHKDIAIQREGAFLILSIGDESWHVPMSNVVFLRQERFLQPSQTAVLGAGKAKA